MSTMDEQVPEEHGDDHPLLNPRNWVIFIACGAVLAIAATGLVWSNWAVPSRSALRHVSLMAPVEVNDSAIDANGASVHERTFKLPDGSKVLLDVKSERVDEALASTGPLEGEIGGTPDTELYVLTRNGQTIIGYDEVVAKKRDKVPGEAGLGVAGLALVALMLLVRRSFFRRRA
jgi:hypothetical protein